MVETVAEMVPERTRDTKLARILRERGLGFGWLAARVTFSYMTCWRVSRGYRSGSPRFYLEAARALGVTVEELIEDEPRQRSA